MEQTYHLVFRGEVLEGQHQSVVAKRVAALLKIDPAKAAALFSGKQVVLKRDAPKSVAAKYQAAFKKAGARLRVVPVETSVAATPAAAPPQAASGTDTGAADAAAPVKKLSLAERLAAEEAAQAAPAPDAASATEGRRPVAADGRPGAALVPDDAPGAEAFSLAPASGDLISEEERPKVAAVAIDVSHLSAAPPESGSLEDVIAHPAPPPAPDVSGITLAEAGADIGTASALVESEIEIPDIDLAEAGADIETLPAPPPPPPPDVDFDVAELGSDLDSESRPPPPPPPDTSHIRLATERASFGGD